MRFGESFLEELKQRLRPSEVIGKHVRLKRQGREYAALSPFTKEKTPSFFVNDEKGFYHCFSSGKHGDIISFVMEIEGLSFTEAVEQLAGQAGMSLPRIDPQARKRAEQSQKSVSWMERAQAFFIHQLGNPQGTEARAYLDARGLTQSDIETFGLGFAPDSFSALKDHLIQQGALMADLIAAGLVIEPQQEGKSPWDRFRNRITFPIYDSRARLVAFGGRAMDKAAKAKYLNSPETGIFQKRQLLYNYPRARKAFSLPPVQRQNWVGRGLIVVEGYMDVIALSRAGFAHAVAPLGTALSAEQLALLWRVGPEPVLCFDGDQAGVRAACRTAYHALGFLKPGHSLRFALLNEGSDPDDIIRQKGAVAMQTLLEAAIPLVDMIWQSEKLAAPVQTPEDRAGLKARLFACINDIKDDSVRQHYRGTLLARFDAEYNEYRKLSGRERPAHLPDPGLQMSMKPQAMQSARERRLIAAVLEWPELLQHIDQSLFALDLKNPQCARLQAALLSYWCTDQGVEKQAVQAYLQTQGLLSELQYARQAHAVMLAAFGGQRVDINERVRLWQAEADKLNPQAVADATAHTHIVEAIENDNAEAMRKHMGRSDISNKP